MMIYVTGDTHGGNNLLKRLYATKYIHGYNDWPDHHILLAGDAGILWSGAACEKDFLEEADRVLERMGATLYWVDGNHENFDMLNSYPVRESDGMRPITERIFHLPRGGLYSIDGVDVFAFGGGMSVDRGMEALGRGYWQEELPSAEEIERGFKTLKMALNVDIVLTHAAPASALPALNLDDGTLYPILRQKKDPTPGVLEQYKEIIEAHWPDAKWYFGHYHKDLVISPNCRALFEDIVCVEEITTKRKKHGQIFRSPRFLAMATTDGEKTDEELLRILIKRQKHIKEILAGMGIYWRPGDKTD
jgi:hypothetical protein